MDGIVVLTDSLHGWKKFCVSLGDKGPRAHPPFGFSDPPRQSVACCMHVLCDGTVRHAFA